jgi:hypothetical protein
MAFHNGKNFWQTLEYPSQPEPFMPGSRVWLLGQPVIHEKGETVIMTGSAGPTGNFSDFNRRGGCFRENEKRQTENF